MASTAKLLAADGGATEAATAADGVKEAGTPAAAPQHQQHQQQWQGVADEEKEAQRRPARRCGRGARAAVSFFAAAAPR